jgi:hypothetical protein
LGWEFKTTYQRIDPRYGFFELEIQSDIYEFVKQTLFLPSSFQAFHLTILSETERNATWNINFFASVSGERQANDKIQNDNNQSILSLVRDRISHLNIVSLRWIESQPVVVQLSDVTLQASFYVGLLFSLISAAMLVRLLTQKIKTEFSKVLVHLSVVCHILLWIRYFYELGIPNTEGCVSQIVLAALVSTLPQR